MAQGDLKPDSNEVVVAYLKSFEQQGRAKVQCMSNCK